MAPKMGDRSRGQKLRVCLACRRREHLRGSSGPVGYVQDWVFYPLTVTQPAKGVKTRAVRCEHCGEQVTVLIASQLSALFSQYVSALIAAPIGLFIVLPFFVLTPLRELSVKAGGGPFAAGLIAFGVFAVILLILVVRCFQSRYELHAVRTADLKHRILPGEG